MSNCCHSCLFSDRKLFLGMLSKRLGENEVRQMFASFGTIEDCSVLRDSNNMSKGCAFVTYSTRQSAIAAIKKLHHSATMEVCILSIQGKLDFLGYILFVNYIKLNIVQIGMMIYLCVAIFVATVVVESLGVSYTLLMQLFNLTTGAVGVQFIHLL